MKADNELIAKLTDVTSKEKTWKCHMTVQLDNEEVKVLAYLQKSGHLDLFPGTKISFSGMPEEIPLPKNPHEFNYKEYLVKQKIHLRYYVPAGQWRILSGTTGFLESSFRIRNSLASIFSILIEDKKALGLVQAIVLGQKKALDETTLESFSNTGARHILTVSGMHVGIVLVILQFFLDLMPVRLVFWRIIKLVLLLIGIWSYAWITGLGAPVLRASFMLSLFLLSKTVKRENVTLNTLFFSALILLIYDPFLLFLLGFQFSYLALLSILLFYKHIYRIFSFSNKILRYIWQLMAVSLAAQSLILPVSVFYFHKIPLFFLVSSVIATPFAFVILFLSMILIAEWYSTHFILEALGRLLELIAGVFHKLIQWLDELSFGTMDAVHLSPVQLAILFLFSISIYWFILKQTKLKLLLILMIAKVWVVVSLFEHFDHPPDEICIYFDRDNCRFDLFSGSTCHAWNSQDQTNQAAGYCNENYRIQKKVSTIIPIVPHKSADDEEMSLAIIHFGGKEIAVLETDQPMIYSCYEIDLLIVHTNNFRAILETVQSVDVEQIVATNKVKRQTLNWLKLTMDIPVWHLEEKGAFVYKLL